MSDEAVLRGACPRGGSGVASGMSAGMWAGTCCAGLVGGLAETGLRPCGVQGPARTPPGPPQDLLRPCEHPSLARADAGAPVHMRVSLAFVAARLNVWLRFGHAVRHVFLDHWRRVALFAPGAVCCRMKWMVDLHGAVMWQLMVLQAPQPFEAAQSVWGVVPGAHILLRAQGSRQVHAVLLAIDRIEALGLDPCTVDEAYWRTAANRLAARQDLPEYSAEQHAAHLARKALQ